MIECTQIKYASNDHETDHGQLTPNFFLIHDYLQKDSSPSLSNASRVRLERKITSLVLLSEPGSSPVQPRNGQHPSQGRVPFADEARS